MVHAKDITLAILAGGEGARMGRPKGLIRIVDRPILSLLLQRLSWPGPTLLVTAPGREHPPAWEEFDGEVTDPVAGVGPLRGVLTALQHATTPTVAVLTVDMPAVAGEQLEFLRDQMDQLPETLGMMLRRMVDGQGQIEPFPSMFRKAAMPVVTERLAEGCRAVYPLARHPRFALIDVPPLWSQAVWTNLNAPADLESYIVSLQLAADDESADLGQPAVGTGDVAISRQRNRQCT